MAEKRTTQKSFENVELGTGSEPGQFDPMNQFEKNKNMRKTQSTDNCYMGTFFLKQKLGLDSKITSCRPEHRIQHRILHI